MNEKIRNVAIIAHVDHPLLISFCGRAAVSAPEYTVPEGHTFSGWNIPETMPAENLVLDAALTVNEYTVTYNINGEIYAIQVYAYGEEVFAPAYEVPDHFTFSG